MPTLYRVHVAFTSRTAAGDAVATVNGATFGALAPSEDAHGGAARAIVAGSACDPFRSGSAWRVCVTARGPARIVDAKPSATMVAAFLGGRLARGGIVPAGEAHAAAMRRDASPAARCDAADAVRAIAAPVGPVEPAPADVLAYPADDADVLATADLPAPATGPRAHVLATDGEPTRAHYDATQCDDNIRDGDVLIIGRTVAILDRAWPVAIVGPCGAFHTLRDGAGDDACDADRARSGRAPLAPIIARIRAGEFTPAER